MIIFRVRNYNVRHSLVSEVSTQLLNDRRDDAREGIEAHPYNNYEMGSPIFSHKS
ncbi:MAG: hypothetical protein H6Q68_2891 [Firmicutes bacterium]|nr:hypothetical protein [Bacillota bacterium]